MTAQYPRSSGTFLVPFAFALIVLLALTVPGAASAQATAKTSAWTWKSGGKIKGDSGFDALTCPSLAFCAGVEGDSVFVSKSPLTSKSWSKVVVDHTPETAENAGDQINSMFALACASDALCVAGDTSQQSVTTATPFGGAPAWHIGELPSGTFVTIERMSCLPTGVCVALDVAGNALSTANAATGVWTAVPLPGSQTSADLYDVSCTAAQCVAVESSHVAWVTKDPADPQPMWTAVKVSGDLSAVSCVGTFCLAGASEGTTLYSTANPSGVWKPVKSGVASLDVDRISCVSAKFCAVSTGGITYTSTTPTRAGSWLAPAKGDSGSGEIHCFSATLCLGEHFGELFVGKA